MQVHNDEADFPINLLNQRRPYEIPPSSYNQELDRFAQEFGAQSRTPNTQVKFRGL
jgi:hypothetical protein